MIPKIYLISREADLDSLKASLHLTPLSAIVVADPRDLQKAMELCPTAEVLSRPIGIFADFEEPLTAVNDDGSLTNV